MKIGYIFLRGLSGPDKIVQATPELSRFLESKVAQNKPRMVVVTRLCLCSPRRPGGGGGRAGGGNRRRPEETSPGYAGAEGDSPCARTIGVAMSTSPAFTFAPVSLCEWSSVTATLANNICLSCSWLVFLLNVCLTVVWFHQ